eukprot:TRINITY_DN8100_c0_g1_i1.p1 TRINITY_DN8100_c0_g1~~TRINITY_DN8100_c0_g1_i1.p1  ORF type:complete len:170 (+),score=25.16 TRINITY_DN8100_c0_g1_i1:55-564(+)
MASESPPQLGFVKEVLFLVFRCVLSLSAAIIGAVGGCFTMCSLNQHYYGQEFHKQLHDLSEHVPAMVVRVAAVLLPPICAWRLSRSSEAWKRRPNVRCRCCRSVTRAIFAALVAGVLLGVLVGPQPGPYDSHVQDRDIRDREKAREKSAKKKQAKQEVEDRAQPPEGDR